MRGYDPRAPRRMVADMGAVLFAMVGPTVVFGLFALLAVRYGAESRPYFDERPVVDDRPNWFPIAAPAGTTTTRTTSRRTASRCRREPRQTAPTSAPGVRRAAASAGDGTARVREQRRDEPSGV